MRLTHKMRDDCTIYDEWKSFTGTNNQGFDMITGLPTSAQINLTTEPNPDQTITTSFIG